MDPRIQYHKLIANRYSLDLPKSVRFDSSVVGLDGIVLNSTEIKTDSKIGIVIIPGMTVPRESYYKLMLSFSDFNVLVFDLRGQAYSGGEMNNTCCIKDINIVGEQFIKQRNLEYLIGIGHSFGGLSLLASSLEPNHPYDLRISVAAPVDMKKTAGKIPGKGGIVTLLTAYLYNLLNVVQNPAYRDNIVSEYEHRSFGDFLRQPRIVALNIRKPSAFNETRQNAQLLTDFFMDITTPSYLIYPGNDERLKIHNIFKDDYVRLNYLSRLKEVEMTLIPGLSHRFNNIPEIQFALSYNNLLVINSISGIIRKELRN
jgi:pimeloyl-ACP methyl ester carboxylesterase